MTPPATRPGAGARRRLLQGAALGLLGAPRWRGACAAEPPATSAPAALASAALQGDLVLLRRAFGLLHPGLHRYRTPAQTDAAFDALGARWQTPRPLGTAYLELSRVLAEVRCGHTWANFANQRPAVQAALFGGRDKLPLRFAWLDGRMVVTEPLASGVARGSEVLSVDGVAAAELLRALRPYVRTDGHNEAQRDARLSVQGRDAVETFDVFHALHFGAREQRTLVLREPGAAGSTTRELASIDGAARRAGRAAGASRDDPGWRLAADGDEATLTMPTWAVYDSRFDWRGAIAETARTLAARGTQRLVLDLRGNEGGLDCGDALLAHLLDTPLPPAGVRRLVRFRSTPADLRPQLDTWDDAFHRLGEGAADAGDGFYRLPDTVRTLQPAAPRLAGLRLAVLIDAANSSATAQFAARVQRQRLGVLVGSASGGNRRGINGGALFFLRLPGSGLAVDLPLVGSFAEGDVPDEGVQPDVAVAATADDIAAGRDPVLERARQVLRRPRPA